VTYERMEKTSSEALSSHCTRVPTGTIANMHLERGALEALQAAKRSRHFEVDLVASRRPFSKP
jgi:hypothetical protein